MTVESLIQELSDAKFYGSLTLKFEAGKVVILKKEETLKPAECRDNRVRQNDEHEESNNC